MSTLSEHKGNGNPEDTKKQIDGLLKHFDVVPSTLDRFIYKYIYVYLIGLFFFIELAYLATPGISLREFLSVSGFSVLIMVGIISVLWRFNVWRLRTPKTLCDLLEKKRIYVPDGDANKLYLRFLENYCDALASPKRHFLSGFLMIGTGIFFGYPIVLWLSSKLPNNLVTIAVVGNLLLMLFFLGAFYCIGILTWAMYISGRYVRKLVRIFRLRIRPLHPDQCGGLKLLGNFCFGLLSPILIGSGLLIGYILLLLIFGKIGSNVVDFAFNVGAYLLILLLYAFPAAIFAFILPLRDIHTQMVSEGERYEDSYISRIEVLQEEIQLLLDIYQVGAAKVLQEEKAMWETLHTPYPTWPFSIRSKIFSTILGASGGILVGMITGALPVILPLIFHRP